MNKVSVAFGMMARKVNEVILIEKFRVNNVRSK